MKFELPYQTHFCQQNLTTDGKLIYMTFYPVKGAPYALTACEKDGRLVWSFTVPPGTVADVIPPSGGAPRVFGPGEHVVAD